MLPLQLTINHVTTASSLKTQGLPLTGLFYFSSLWQLLFVSMKYIYFIGIFSQKQL
jgi:hypothetical protein